MGLIEDFEAQYKAEDLDMHSGLFSAKIRIPDVMNKLLFRFDLVFRTATLYGDGYDVLFDGDGVIDVSGNFAGKRMFGSSLMRESIPENDIRRAGWKAYDAVLSSLYRKAYPLAVGMVKEQREASKSLPESNIRDSITKESGKSGYSVQIENDRQGYNLYFSRSGSDIREAYDNLYDMVKHLKGDLEKEIPYAHRVSERKQRESLAENVDLSGFLPDVPQKAERIDTDREEVR